MNLLEQYIIEAEDDARVDEVTIHDKSMKLPSIKHKWVARLINAKRDESKLIRQKRAAIADIAVKLKEKGKVNLSDASINAAASKHESISKIQEQIDEYKDIIEYLEKLERIFSSITWDYKNIVEIMKLETM
jgi:predicted transcriptional regulator YheO